MSQITVVGKHPLNGEIQIQGSKNAALPILAASLLLKGTSVLKHCPDITDVTDTLEIMRHLGCVVKRVGNDVIVNAENISCVDVTEEAASNMRSSTMFLGALLGRMKKAVVRYPGGCVIGKRPINLHLQALRAMGAVILETNEVLHCEAPKLYGTEICFPTVSVGATENAILAAVTAEGTTILRNCAMEPEVSALCDFLSECGAKIYGSGTKIIKITGVSRLHACEYRLPSDRIVAGTYLAAAAVTGGMITVLGVNPNELGSVTKVLSEAGCRIAVTKDTIMLKAPERLKSVPYTETGVYPGFPTDMQSQLTAIMAFAKGTSVIRETIFEKRFRIVPALREMGAGIEISNDILIIEGKERLYGAAMTAEELRGSAAMLIAGLAAEGETTIRQLKFMRRGYENLPEGLLSLGAKLSVSA